MGEGEATPVPDDAWKLTGINWTFLALNLPWAHVLVTFLLTVVPAIVVHVTVMPRTRPFRVYDAVRPFAQVPASKVTWAKCLRCSLALRVRSICCFSDVDV